MKKRTLERLTLHRETLRLLNAGELLEAAGGESEGFSQCNTLCITCPPKTCAIACDTAAC